MDKLFPFWFWLVQVRFYKKLTYQAYTADLWAAAAIVDPWGCTEDGFIDFRAWLIAQGRESYETVLVDPESLVDILEIGMETQVEELSYIANEAYTKKTGKEKIPLLKGMTHPELRGELPEDRMQSKAMYPRLAKKFG